jgi:hypothetical protein
MKHCWSMGQEGTPLGRAGLHDAAISLCSRRLKVSSPALLSSISITAVACKTSFPDADTAHLILVRPEGQRLPESFSTKHMPFFSDHDPEYADAQEMPI